MNLEQIKWRAAVKNFDPNKKIDDKTWQQIKEALFLTPSSFGLQPWKFIEVKNPETRQKLRQSSWNQPQVTDASNMIVFASLKSIDEEYVDFFLNKYAQAKNIDVEQLSGYRQTILGFIAAKSKEELEAWLRSQLYISVGFILNFCAVNQIDTCPMEGFVANEYQQILNIDEKYAVRCAVVFGYRSENEVMAKQPKFRFTSDFVFEER